MSVVEEKPFSESQQTPPMKWSPEHEDILIEWADKAMCYRWLHSKCNQKYSGLNAWYTIPVIVMSTVTGTANFAQQQLPIEYQTYASMLIGAINIFAGILSTIQQYLKISQLNEGHRVAALSWDKFYRNIKVELAKNPLERIDVALMLKSCKEEYDRLMEISPMVDIDIIHKFNDRFKASDIKKPEICDILVSTIEMKKDWYTQMEVDLNSGLSNNKLNEMSQVIIDLQNREVEKEKDYINEKENMLKKKEEEIEKIMESQKKVDDFKRKFFELHHRYPIQEEIDEMVNVESKPPVRIPTSRIPSMNINNFAISND